MYGKNDSRRRTECVSDKSQDLQSKIIQITMEIVLLLFSFTKVLSKRFKLKEINPIALVCVCARVMCYVCVG